jgi:hypothetical protein
VRQGAYPAAPVLPGIEIEAEVESGALDFGFAFYPPARTSVV